MPCIGKLLRIIILPGLLVALPACRQQTMADKQTHMRLQSTHETAACAWLGETGRPQRMKNTSAHIEDSIDRDLRKSENNVGDVQRYWQRDWDRWFERDGRYGPEAWKIIRGKTDRIEPNAIILFF